MKRHEMRLRELSKALRDAYRGSGVARRVRYFNGWVDRAVPGAGGAGGYDHAETGRKARPSF
ncbi:hypothetical protein [Candidatus Palauibacter sp.]|uniref:hypothetical protein n=1 Tax=Candidatus Palauibacter sp. TaxID=3101350 RepID=UPI003B01C58E